MLEKVFKTRRGLAIVIPADVAQRYHLQAGVEVEISPVEEGIFLEPQDVGPWFSIEWERALDAVVERFRGAFEMMKEPPPDTGEAEQPGKAP